MALKQNEILDTLRIRSDQDVVERNIAAFSVAGGAVIGKGLKIGNTDNTTPGNMRYSHGKFQGFVECKNQWETFNNINLTDGNCVNTIDDVENSIAIFNSDNELAPSSIHITECCNITGVCDLNASGNITGGTLYIDDVSLFNGGATFNEDVIFNGNITVIGEADAVFQDNVSITGTLKVGENATFESDVEILEDLKVGGTSCFTGAATFKDHVKILDNSLEITGTNYTGYTFPTGPLISGNILLYDGNNLIFTGSQNINELPTGDCYSDYLFWDTGANPTDGSWKNGNHDSKNSVHIGCGAGNTNQGTSSVAIGLNAGNTEQQQNSIAIGLNAGQTEQQQNSVAIGLNAGQTEQQQDSVAIGFQAGQMGQQQNSVAIGVNAGNTGQQPKSIAIGTNAGNSNQGSVGIAIGNEAGFSNQSVNSIAIGREAGYTNLGTNSMAIGNQAERDSNGHTGTIVLNASGVVLNSHESNAFYVNPIRPESTNYVLNYKPIIGGVLTGDNDGGGEITYTEKAYLEYYGISDFIVYTDIYYDFLDNGIINTPFSNLFEKVNPINLKYNGNQTKLFKVAAILTIGSIANTTISIKIYKNDIDITAFPILIDIKSANPLRQNFKSECFVELSENDKIKLMIKDTVNNDSNTIFIQYVVHITEV
jgi:hypothetical protein